MAQSIGATPIAVLAGSALVAIAVYFGLRARPAPVPPAVNVTATPGAPSPIPKTDAVAITGGVGSVLAGATGVAPPTAPDVQADVLAALEKQRATLLEQCWNPLTKGQTSPPPASYEIDVSFDAAGNEVARGLSAKRGASNELTRCLNVHGPSLSIPARGSRVRARVPFTLP